MITSSDLLAAIAACKAQQRQCRRTMAELGALLDKLEAARRELNAQPMKGAEHDEDHEAA